ncbi:MAG: transposase, partial [Flavobacteriaceae bacterium]|nr:transposase [Flavobacteriaceae bacterium]
MLQDQDIHKVDELKTDFTHRWFEVENILELIDIFNFSSLLGSFSFFKKQGFSFQYVISALLLLPFLGASNVNNVSSNCFEAKKDVFYRLKNNPLIDWRSILWLFVIKFIAIGKAKASEDSSSPKCLIIDDSFLAKSGKYIEKISKMWDHVSKKYLLGFKVNLLGYWDGKTFLSIDFAIHREKGKNEKKPCGLTLKEIKKQSKKNRSRDMASFEREKEADASKIETGIKMFKRAVKNGLSIDYLLMDSWFTCNEFISAVSAVKKQTIHLIGMYKIATTKFILKEQEYTIAQLRNKLGKAKRNRKTGYYYLEAIVLLDGKEVKLFYSRKGRRGKWKTILSTNTNLSFQAMLKIYAIRWTIEVFFKESKQLFGLGKEQANDFDAQIAAVTLVMMQHILISIRYRFENYESKGEVFKQAKVEVFKYRLSD